MTGDRPFHRQHTNLSYKRREETMKRNVYFILPAYAGWYRRTRLHVLRSWSTEYRFSDSFLKGSETQRETGEILWFAHLSYIIETNKQNIHPALSHQSIQAHKKVQACISSRASFALSFSLSMLQVPKYLSAACLVALMPCRTTLSQKILA